MGEDVTVERVAPLSLAQEGDLSFVLWPKDIRKARITRASLLITTMDMAASYADTFSSSLLVTDDIPKAFSVLSQAILSKQLRPYVIIRPNPAQSTAIHSSAIIGAGASIGSGCSIGPGVVIHDQVVMGNNCVIKANTVIGSAAFVPWGLACCENLVSLGSVVIEDNVSIGALCTIDRGLLGPTVIGQKSLIDNMVHIGHDTRLGSSVVMAGQSGLAGFVSIGDGVTLGGHVGVVPHVIIEEGARISAKSLVHCDIKRYQIWSGNPSLPHGVYLRVYGYLKRMFQP